MTNTLNSGEAEQSVQRISLPDGRPVWMVSRYPDARTVLTDARLSNDTARMGGMAPLAALPEEIRSVVAKDMLNSDPPEHTRRRRLLAPAFTGHKVAALRSRVCAIVDELLSELDDEVDLVERFASQVSLRVLAEIIGIAPRDRAKVLAWSDTFVTELLVPSDSLVDATRSLLGYARDLVAHKRANPRDDLVSRIVTTTDGADEEELASTVFVLMIAGQTATAQLIAKGLALLLTHPDQLAALRAEPELISTTVDEVLRHAPPLNVSGFRMTTEPITVADTTIPAGEIVLCALDAINRDETRFPDPETFDIRREDNPHLSFGHGIHHCLGANLARLEAEVAIGRLLTRFPDLRLAVPADELVWADRGIMRTLEALPALLRAHAPAMP